MGKRIISQRRGRGSPTYKSPKHRFVGAVGFTDFATEKIDGEVIELVNCPGHSAPLMIVEYANGNASLLPAPIGIRKGQFVQAGMGSGVAAGNVLSLSEIPTGTKISNIERVPFDKGQLARTGGSSALVVGKEGKKVLVKMPSKKIVKFDSKCRAMIGKIAGGGRREKPFLRAGSKYHAMRAKNKLYPRVSGNAMNAVDHPHGCTHTRNTKRSTTVSRNTPPGAKVGLIAARRTGRKKK